MSTAIVVGAGPNGLAAGVALAKAGLQVTVLEAADEIGGGTRTSEAIIPGLLHDHCSAIHPMAVGSQFLPASGLDRYGLSWRLPEIDCVHPLDGGQRRACCTARSRPPPTGWAPTAPGGGACSARRRPVSMRLSEDIMGPLLRVPHASVDAGPLRRPHRAARIHPGPVVSHRRSSGVVRRRRGARLSAAALPA